MKVPLKKNALAPVQTNPENETFPVPSHRRKPPRVILQPELTVVVFPPGVHSPPGHGDNLFQRNGTYQYMNATGPLSYTINISASRSCSARNNI